MFNHAAVTPPDTTDIGGSGKREPQSAHPISAADISDEYTLAYTDQAVDNAAQLAKLLAE